MDFKLTSLVQCTGGARALLIAEGFLAARTSWTETYGYKFGISIDGNGAACSRPKIIMKSNRTLLKHRFDNVLYYSAAVKAGKHFVSIDSDEGVIDVVRTEMQPHGAYEHVAHAGKELGDTLLCRKAILSYTGALLRTYQSCVTRNG